MVGSGLREGSKEAIGVMALHEALRGVCLNSDWTYSVFWTIRPRPRVRGGNGFKIGDDNGSLMLMWEDGFCRSRGVDGEQDPVRKAFSKMSIQLYNYGEGLMGKVASDKCHKWVFKKPTESETNASNFWQSSFDAVPSEWTDQFESGIQTIAVIQAGHGLLQLGSCSIVAEDLHFVLKMRHTFESLGKQSGLYLSQLFSSTRNNATSLSATIPTNQPTVRPPPLFNWEQSPLPSPPGLSIPPTEHDTIGDEEHDIKWPNGLTYFNALSGKSDNAELLFNPEGSGTVNPGECLDSRTEMEDKFRRSFSLPARMGTSPSLTFPQEHVQEYGNEGGMCRDALEAFLELEG